MPCREIFNSSIKNKIMPKNKQYNLSLCFPVVSRPDSAPRPTPTGQARNMVQNAPKISSGDQL